MPRHGPRIPPAKAPSMPPVDAARAAVVKALDRQDGDGVDWKLAAEALFRAAFDVLDRLPVDQKAALARRVYKGVELRITGGYADGSAPSKNPIPDSELAPSNTADLKSSPPGPAKWQLYSH